MKQYWYMSTAGFLSSPHVILHWVIKIYDKLVDTYINPLLNSYIKLWSLPAKIFLFAFKILHHIFK